MANGNLCILFFGNLVNGADVQWDAVGELNLEESDVNGVTANTMKM